jgi:hypothetical protein
LDTADNLRHMDAEDGDRVVASTILLDYPDKKMCGSSLDSDICRNKVCHCCHYFGRKTHTLNSHHQVVLLELDFQLGLERWTGWIYSEKSAMALQAVMVSDSLLVRTRNYCWG